MNPLLIALIVVVALGLLALVLVQALHPSPWVRKQVENVYGPAYAMGIMVGVMVWALLARP